MEVRGGAGYIEEWSDARLVRDAHLGSIWEGTSNIVALDAMRAIRREDSLAALRPTLEAMLPESRPGTLGAALHSALERACGFAARVAKNNDALHARQAATGLYYAIAATVLAHEGTRLGAQGDARRLLLAALIDTHRLRARDPLAPVEGTREAAFAELLLPETPVAPAAAEKLLAAGPRAS